MDTTAKRRTDAPRRLGMARGFALFLGAFSLLNLLGELRNRYFDANVWWISFRPLPDLVGHAVLLVAGFILIAFAVRPLTRAARRRVTIATLGVLLVTTLANAAAFYVLLLRGEFSSRLPVPLSLLHFGALLIIFTAAVDNPPRESLSRRDRRWALATFAACLVGFPVLQMFFFGLTDYRRPADAIVVFGARVYADGRLSSAVADRMTIAGGLYRQGLAPKVIVSGGPSDGDVHETQAMRTMAIGLGVRDEDILLDDRGTNTENTVRNTCTVFRAEGIRRVLAVSHFYHLPRVKLAYQRYGWDVYTVPVRVPLRGTPKFMVREVAAIWAYYLRPLV